jgi:flagellar FliJ protein
MAKFALQLLLNRAADEADEAARRLGLAMRTEQEAKARMGLIRQYQSEYVGRFQAAQRAGLSPGQWQNFEAFIDRLDEGEDQQKSLITQAQTGTEQARQDWIARNNRLKALEALERRHREAEAKKAQKAEQKLSDEFAQNRFLRRERHI